MHFNLINVINRVDLPHQAGSLAFIRLNMQFPDSSSLIRKYDVPVPRYTSYPTMPCWDTDKFTVNEWEASVQRCFDETNNQQGISVYIHLPFCESLCTYCACNTRITRNHDVEERYVESLLREWDYYLRLFGKRPVIRELHLGGGTPTFFKPENLKKLILGILFNSFIHPEKEFGFEGHPNNTTAEHLQTLHDLGFTRVSFGVQDLDPKVQQTIHRVQPLENLERVTRESRALGYTSISYDLIYGLPFQTKQTVTDTINQVITLLPDRIAFYSYAHVPWIRPGQRGYEDADLPSDVRKRELYETGRVLLGAHDYHDIGMDHFALPHDALFTAQQEGKLHRNFMGYTTSRTDLLIGLGTSAISDAGYAYAQNLKQVETYEDAVAKDGTAIFKGHIQTGEDLATKQIILDIACKGRLPGKELRRATDDKTINTLSEMRDEGIIAITSDGGFEVTPAGRPFIRNICRVFDKRATAAERQKAGAIFSQSI